MTPEQLAQFDDMKKRLELLERAENVAFIKSIERNISFVTQADLATLTLTELADVSDTAPTSGQVLEWNGSVWAPATDNV